MAITFSASAKWILAGEHSILRGYRAISLPRTDLKLKLTFTPADSLDLKISPVEATQTIHSILNKFKVLKKPVPEKSIFGELSVTSEIPFGAGLGSSAALCLVIVRWLSQFYSIEESEVCSLATLLENEFHGQSSGIDVATIYYSEPIRIQLRIDPITLQKFPQIHKLGIHSIPHFTFHDTGLRASTRSCIEQVQLLGQANSRFAKEIDETMNQAAIEAEAGLIEYSNGNLEAGNRQVAQAMRLGQSCFENWGLSPRPVSDLIQKLYSKGARAVKLTGSGGGGMVVALWDKPEVRDYL